MKDGSSSMNCHHCSFGGQGSYNGAGGDAPKTVQKRDQTQFKPLANGAAGAIAHIEAVQTAVEGLPETAEIR